MPIINIPVDLLLRLVNRESKVIDEPQLVQTLDDMGVETEEMATTNVYSCLACDNAIERTDAQGEPLVCGKCGTDFRQRGELLKPNCAGGVDRKWRSLRSVQLPKLVRLLVRKDRTRVG